VRKHLAVAARQPLWRAVFAAALCGILVLAVLPSQGTSSFPHVDKLQHAAAFIALWALGWRAGLRQPVWLLAAGLLVFGVTIEIAQSFTPNRQPSLGDVVADAAGIALGWWLLRRRG
jgi:VanZ family protein